jgi:NitT/TauT family transport system substrate-binding protein
MGLDVRKYGLFLALLLALLISACAPQQPAAAAPLKVVVIPVLDSIPLYVAQQEGFFEKHGVQVELVPVGSAPERDQLIAAGQADGMINEVFSNIYSNQDEVKLQAVRYARAATADSPLFSILAAKDAGIESVAGLKGVEIGVSDGTIIAYLTDRILEREGFAPDEIATVSVANIRDRMTLLNSGELKAATLPEPLTSLSVLQGARVVIDDTKYPEYSFSTLTFRKAVIDSNPEGVRGVVAAFEDAVAAINSDPGRFQTLLAEQKLVPEPLLGTFVLPKYVAAGVPTEAQYEDMQDWAEREGLIKRRVPYSDTVNGSFLPK